MAFITLTRNNGTVFSVRADDIIRFEPDQTGEGSNIFVKPDGDPIGVVEPYALIVSRLKELGEKFG
jgi:hypothetical protein